MTAFIIWPEAIDAEFRPAYQAETGETIQDVPATDGARFMVGTARATAEHLTDLAAAFPDLQYGPDPTELGWVPAVEDA